jgi:hypothetical protein
VVSELEAGPAPRKRRTLADTEETANILWYGEQGTGKTLDMATLARRGLVTFVNAEKGLKRRPLRDWDVPLENLELADPKSYKGLEALYWDIRQRIETKSVEAPIGVLFDSLTEISKLVTEGQVMERVQRKQSEADARMEVPKDADVNPFRVHLDDYGVMTEQLRHLIRLFRDLPIHFGSSALTRRDVDASGGGETGDSVVYRPGLTPKLGADTVGYMDVVVATKIAVDGRYVGVTKPRYGLVGKDRFGVLPTTMVDPTLDRILAVIHDELTPEEVAWTPPE